MRCLAFATVALCPALALGNGRAPLTNGVHFRPGDNQSLYVASTFGLLISHDDGCSFRWVCEQNIGYAGTFDPKYRVAQDGTIFATTYTGLRVSRDGGCSFITATADAPAGDPGRIADSWVDAIDIGPTGEVWVVTADSGKPNNVYRSTDNAKTFAPSGLASPSVWWKSVAVAPSRPQRIYVTGYQVAGALPDGGQSPPTTHLMISDDSGAHWRESPLTGVGFAAMPLVYVLGVDPDDPDSLVISSSLANGAGDRLYRSSDGGLTFSDVLDTASPIVDLAIEAGGGVLVATLGSGGAGAGSFQSTDHGASFSAMISPPQLACVGQRGDGAVFGCGANWEPDFMAVARTRDGRTWSKQFRFVELAGTLDCPAGTGEHDTCAAMWPALEQQFATTGPTGCGIGPALNDDVVTRPPQKKPAGSGCCETGAAPGALGGVALLTALCAGFALRRRRR
jgi:hypothetical protein